MRCAKAGKPDTARPLSTRSFYIEQLWNRAGARCTLVELYYTREL